MSVVVVDPELITLKWTTIGVPVVPVAPEPLYGVTVSVWLPSDGVHGR